MISESNLNRYRLFCAVAEAGSISAAAELNFISQPAISKSITKMENSFDTQLFFRNHNGVTLTEEGKILYTQLKEAFEIIKSGEDQLRRINEMGIGHLRLGASGVLTKHILIPYLKRFIADNPNVKITVESRSSAHILRMLSDNDIDIALAVKPLSIADTIFTQTHAIHDAFVCTKDYIENIKKPDQTFDFWRDATIILLDSGNVSRIHIEKYFKDNDITPRQVLETTGMELLIDFAKIGLGVACVIEEFVTDEIKSGELVKIPIGKPIPPRAIGFATSKNVKPTNTMKRFMKLYESV
ncbi:MAG: LysR family transcriptional regulator [Ruminococcus sp.]|jgi:DNA-binding transcriptional LysR family regulator|nr:LysR family transcriptional regulator [Ruminococcus sp.]